MLSAVHCGRPCLALVMFCARAGGGGRDRGIQAVQAAPPSGTLAAGCDLARNRTIVSALAGLCFALACVAHVLSWCALLIYVSFSCVPFCVLTLVVSNYPWGMRVFLNERVRARGAR
jgi:hypothetical protein